MRSENIRISAGAEGGKAFGAKERRVAMMRKFGNTNFAAYDKDNPVYVNGTTLARKLRIAFTENDQYLGIKFQDGKIVFIDVTREEFTDYLKEVGSVQCDKETGAKAVKVAVGHTKEEVETLLAGKNLPEEEAAARNFGNTTFAAYDTENPVYVNGSALARKLRVAMENDWPYLGIEFQNGKIIYIDVTKESFSDYLKDEGSVRCDKETGSKAVKAEIGRTKEEVEALLKGKNLPGTSEPRKFENTNFAAYDTKNPVYVNLADLARKLRIAFAERAPYLAVKFQDGKIIYIEIGNEEFTDYLKEVDSVQCDKETGAKAVKVAVGFTKSELKKELEG